MTTESGRPRTRTVKVGYLARVEGEAALEVRIRGGRVERARLSIFEPPRYFEALLRGRRFDETPDITARICGICPVAYQMSAVHAIERAFGVACSGEIRDLRRLLFCAEWIESHTLHIHMLHAPDFLGYDGAVSMVREHGEHVRRALALKKTGNALLALLGGREIHPINVRVGGFYRIPTRGELLAIRPDLERARDQALETVRWVSRFEYPDVPARDAELVALRHPDEYPLNEGRIVSSRGLDIDVDDYESAFEEYHLERSTALYARIRGRGDYLVGPLARYSLNFDRLSPLARAAAREAGLGPTCHDPYRSIVVRAVEVVYACDEALRIIEQYRPPAAAAVTIEPGREVTGCAATEAPRGLLYHRYRVGADGCLLEAKIVPPTSQNQASIEADLVACLGSALDLPDDALRRRCEQTVRNYDPCISCATHFLRLDVDRA
jgi:coenzyme F420-reducing hydrogenase alpha subunit